MQYLIKIDGEWYIARRGKILRQAWWISMGENRALAKIGNEDYWIAVNKLEKVFDLLHRIVLIAEYK